MKNMRSCIYRGHVRHRRFTPVEHAFRYPLFMMYLDLDELPHVLDVHPLWSARRPAPAWFRRRDYHGDAAVPLDEAVRATVAEQTGSRPRGPIRLLTHLRYFGYCFNPVSFYYCFDEEDRRVETIVAEVNNTPWGERHCYVLPMSEETIIAQQTVIVRDGIIGAIGRIDAYQLPDAKGYTSMVRYLIQESDEERQRYREQVREAEAGHADAIVVACLRFGHVPFQAQRGFHAVAAAAEGTSGRHPPAGVLPVAQILDRDGT